MNKALLIQLWMFVIGFLFCNLHRRTFDPVFRVLTALPIGWALFVICGTVVYGVYFAPASQMLLLVGLAVTTLALAVANITYGRLSADAVGLAGAGLVVLTAACFIVNSLSIVTMVSDSSYMARFGQNIGLGNYEGSRKIFSMWGPFVPLVHSVTNLLDQKLYWQFQPILSVNFVAIVFYTLYTMIRQYRSMFQSCVAAMVFVSVMVLSNMFIFHVFYIHVMLISALYMYLFVFALFMMQQQPGRAYQQLALISLIAFSLARIEAPLYAALVLVVVTFWHGWSYVDRLKLIIPFVVLCVAWYARVYFILPPDPDLLTREFAIAVISLLVGLGLFATASGLRGLDPIVRRLPLTILIGSAFVSIVFIVAKPDHMLTSLISILRNMFIYGHWGLTWYVIAFLAAELYFAHPATQRHWLPVLFISYVLLVYNLSYVSREPYHLADFDSANRLLLLALPLVLLYLSFRFAKVQQTRTDSRRSSKFSADGEHGPASPIHRRGGRFR